VWFRKTYNSSKEFCEQPDRASRLEQALADVTGQAVRIEFALLDDPAEAAQPVRKPVSTRSRLVERSQHPMVRRAEELFKARPVGVEAPE
jgi:hypothetical protein